MPVIKIKVKDGGIIETDYEGFPGMSCKVAEDELRSRLSDIKFEKISDEPKEDELLQEEKQYE